MENKIAIGSLANLLAQSTGKSKKLCDDFLREFFRVVAEALQEGESVKIKGLGSFKLAEVESRNSVNVNTGEPHEIASFKKVVFSPAKELAAAINAPFEEFKSVEMEDEMPEDIFIEEEVQDNEEPAEEIVEEEPAEEEAIEENSVVEGMGNENLIKEESLEIGSDEEHEDDDITYQAYTEPIDDPIENDIKEPLNEVAPQIVAMPMEEPQKSRFGLGFLLGSLSTLVVCVIIFMLGCFLDWWPVNFGSPKEIVAETKVDEIESPTGEEETEIEPLPETETVYDTVSTTRYLTTIARDHYGNFNFWPYIYFENESILGHPDRITPGTKIIVPDLSKYGVDPSNKEDIATAKKKAFEIYSRFK